jgi:glycosyltransferase involved in cell wall biosynthesis
MPTAAIVHNHPIHYKNLLFQELQRRELSFEVLFVASGSHNRLETPSCGYPHRWCYEGSYENAPAPAVARFVWSSLAELDPRVVVISGYYDVAGWAAWAWAELHGRPKLLWAESNRFDYPRRHWKERIKSAFVRRCAAANVYGESNREYLRDLGMPDSRITTKRAVIDTGLFQYSPPRTGEHPRRVLLYVGRFSPEKNLERLLRAWARLVRDRTCPPARLALVGYGPLEESLRGLASELRLWNTVEFRGPALQQELPAVYRGADALVLPSLREPWGLVVLEGMACGLPVAVSNLCGCARDVVSDATGVTFDPCSDEDLLSALRDLMSRPQAQLESMGCAASEVACQYTPQNSARLVMATVASLLAGAGASACLGSPKDLPHLAEES